MADFVLKGHICHSLDRNQIGVFENHYLVCVDNLCVGIFPELPTNYMNLLLVDYGD